MWYFLNHNSDITVLHTEQHHYAGRAMSFIMGKGLMFSSLRHQIKLAVGPAIPLSDVPVALGLKELRYETDHLRQLH
jgi:hypothetical protein